MDERIIIVINLEFLTWSAEVSFPKTPKPQNPKTPLNNDKYARKNKFLYVISFQ